MPDSKLQDIKTTLNHLIHLARRAGASEVEVAISFDKGFSISTRLEEVESVEYNQDKSCAITVYFGKRRGSVTSSDLSEPVLVSLIEKACDIAKASDEDPYVGLAEKALMAKEFTDLSLDWPWEISPEEATTKAIACESKALTMDGRIVNSDGCMLSTHRFIRGYANSQDFCDVFNATRHSIACALMAKDQDGVKRDYDYTTARDARQLTAPEKLAAFAVDRTLARLSAKKLVTQTCPVVFSSDVSNSILSTLISAISGGAIYRKASFLLDKVGQKILPDRYSIFERPFQSMGLGSANYDLEGVATRENIFIEGGVLKSYVLDSYAARRLGMETTANSGGVHNLTLSNDGCQQQDLLDEMGTGLLVTSLMGSAVSIITGEYSRGASGFWVENGEIAYPVDEITIAANLSEMLNGIVLVANDTDPRKSTQCGSLLIKSMTIGGS